ncbi:MAG: NADH-quinone oxidoreductase subunit A [Deltaproteobacteria bacterium]|nr:NADH-quinone oxidoreductase subunit A [Deltaproteobacteria bacterium]
MPNYILIAVLFVIAAIIGGALFTLATIIGPKVRTAQKQEPFFCGNQGGKFNPRMSVKFYVVALLFITFDIEAVFLYPWAVTFTEYGWTAFWSMVTFVAILAIGLAYVWKGGALDWD